MKFKSFFSRDRINRSHKIGLSLGGGGTRGFAHLGVLKAFEEHGIDFDCVAGTSIGSFVGVMYAAGMTTDEMIRESLKFKIRDVKTTRLPFAPSRTDRFEEIIKENVGDINFSELKKLFFAVAVDLKTGEEVIFSQGNVIKAVAGSCALPMLFSPVKYGEYNLVDGGIKNTVPTDVLKKSGCKYVVAVDVNPRRTPGTQNTGILDVLAASIRIMMKENADKGRRIADILIEPDTSSYSSLKTEGAKEMIQEGYRSALEHIDEIKKLTGITRRYKQRTIAQKVKRQNRQFLDESIVE